MNDILFISLYDDNGHIFNQRSATMKCTTGLQPHRTPRKMKNHRPVDFGGGLFVRYLRIAIGGLTAFKLSVSKGIKGTAE